jgi:hypothetical protein
MITHTRYSLADIGFPFLFVRFLPRLPLHGFVESGARFAEEHVNPILVAWEVLFREYVAILDSERGIVSINILALKDVVFRDVFVIRPAVESQTDLKDPVSFELLMMLLMRACPVCDSIPF